MTRFLKSDLDETLSEASCCLTSTAHFLEGGEILENDIFSGQPVVEAPQMDFGQHQWTKAKAFGQFADQLPHVA